MRPSGRRWRVESRPFGPISGSISCPCAEVTRPLQCEGNLSFVTDLKRLRHDLSPRRSTGVASVPLAGSPDWSERSLAEGHGGAEIRGDPGLRSGPARLSDPNDQTFSEARHKGQDQGSRTRRPRPHGPRRTGSGSMDDAGPDLVERRRPGARQNTADHRRGSLRRCRGQGSEPQWPSPTRTWRGDVSTGSPGLASPRSIPADPALATRSPAA